MVSPQGEALTKRVSIPTLQRPSSSLPFVHRGHFLNKACSSTLLSCMSPVSTVLNDIISTMFNRKFMEELFKPQELYSKKALRTVYDRLAHASIMRLNQASMDKVSRQLPPSPLGCISCIFCGLSWTGIRYDVRKGALQKQKALVNIATEFQSWEGAQKSSAPALPLYCLCHSTCPTRVLVLTPVFMNTLTQP